MASKGINNLLKSVDAILGRLKSSEKRMVYSASYGLSFDVNISRIPDIGPSITRLRDEFNRSLAIELRTALDEAISANVWGDDGDNDLVDSGNLRDSLQIQVTSNGVMIDYTAEYAALVHYGGYILPYGNQNATRVYITGRPWVESVLYGTGPIPGYNFKELFNRTKGRIFG